MSENNISLEQAAIDYHNKQYGRPKDWASIELTERQHANNIHAGFKAGAQWQKEQIKHALEIATNLAIGYHLRYPEEFPILLGHTNEAAVSIVQNLFIDMYVTI